MKERLISPEIREETVDRILAIISTVSIRGLRHLSFLNLSLKGKESSCLISILCDTGLIERLVNVAPPLPAPLRVFIADAMAHAGVPQPTGQRHGRREHRAARRHHPAGHVAGEPGGRRFPHLQ